MNKVNSFIKSFVAIVTGDNATAQAEKAKRQADSALKTHISILKGDLVSKEDAVTAAAENLVKALVNNGKSIENRDVYVSNLLNRKNEDTIANSELKKHLEKIAFLEGLLSLLDAEVEE